MEAIKLLEKQILSGTLFHALIFSGPDGSGKLDTARNLAQKSGGVAFVLDAAEKSAEEFRQFTELSRLGTGQKQFFIVDNAHKLSASSFSAFLKTLEENRGHSTFVLLDESQSLPETIISRCITIRFRKTDEADTHITLPNTKTERIVWADKTASEENIDDILNDLYQQSKLDLEKGVVNANRRMRLVLDAISQSKHNANKKLFLHHLANNW